MEQLPSPWILLQRLMSRLGPSSHQETVVYRCLHHTKENLDPYLVLPECSCWSWRPKSKRNISFPSTFTSIPSHTISVVHFPLCLHCVSTLSVISDRTWLVVFIWCILLLYFDFKGIAISFVCRVEQKHIPNA